MRVVLCDDTKDEIEKYSDILNMAAHNINIDLELLQFSSGKQMLFELEDMKQPPDIIFLDINMPEFNGIETAEKLREYGYKGELIFITVSKTHMLPAFDVQAFNYIVKGETSVERVEEIFSKAAEIASEKQKEYMLFTGVGEYRNIAVGSIHYFEVNQKIITVYYGNDNSFEFVSTMGKIENLLFTRGFVRVHRAYMVAIDHISSFTYEELRLYNGDVIPIGRKYYAALKEAMSKRQIK